MLRWSRQKHYSVAAAAAIALKKRALPAVPKDGTAPGARAVSRYTAFIVLARRLRRSRCPGFLLIRSYIIFEACLHCSRRSELVPRRKSPCMFWFSGISFNMITGCGACGQRGARWITGLSLSTASAPVRRRRIVHKSTAFFGFGEAARNPLGFVARPQAWSAASIVFQNPNDCLGS